jgi:hypothetical protein
MASAPSLGAAARALGVNRSTVFRWVRDGKVQAPGGKRRRDPPAADVVAAVAGPQSPAAWAASTREAFALTGTEAALLDLAVDALTLARDPAMAPAIRLSAAGRFQQLVRQLNFEEVPDDGEATTDRTGRRPWPRRSA